MSREWKPGDVALVTSWRGKDQPAFRVARDTTSNVWVVLTDGDTRGLAEGEVTEARPAVLFAPPEGLADLVRRAADLCIDEIKVPLTELAFEIARQTPPPKPKEPTGLGAVVQDAGGSLWFRMTLENQTWAGEVWQEQCGCDADRWTKWADIDVVRVLSEGVTP